MKELNEIQVHLDAPKNQFNSFGKYNYRSCEDILAGLKPLIKKHKCIVMISDDIQIIGDRIYVKATATIKNSEGEEISASAFAREPVMKKGMDDAQVTGSASSYARKYALNGLFAIDDSKDMDYLNEDSGRKRSVIAATIDKFKVDEFFKSNSIDAFNACKNVDKYFNVDGVNSSNMTTEQVAYVFQYQQYFIDTYQL